ncbi:B12-binding domain-containing radical SAM protein [Patescibacteria group bacterium]|nr:B12-binding domain-containing radical SAM protein [Patescibacteria group bacterium]
MKIILINPPVFNDIGRILAGTPPLGLLYIGAFLEKNGFNDVKVIDADAAQISWDSLGDLFKKEKPDIVGISGASFVFPAIIKTAKIAKQNLPGCIVIAGGFGPSKEPEKTLKSGKGEIDYVVLGEGELTFLELVKNIEKKERGFSEIDGIAFLRNGEAFLTKPREYLKDLDSLPWPAFHLLQPEFLAYCGPNVDCKDMLPPTAVIVASRGCPHRCTFCSLGSKMYRQRKPENIIDEIEFYVRKFGVRSIQLYDDEFIGLSPKQNEWIEEICNEIIGRGLNKKLSFLVQGRCSQFVELKTLKKMKEANFVWIWWGAESGSQKILDSIKKDIKVENIIKDVRLAKQAGIKSLLYLMVGFPGETPADIKLTIDLIKTAKPEQVRIHIISPFPGSELRKYFEEHNLLETEDYYNFDARNNVIHHTEEMSAEEIKKYYRYLVLRFENSYLYSIKHALRLLGSPGNWGRLLKNLKSLIFFNFGAKQRN